MPDLKNWVSYEEMYGGKNNKTMNLHSFFDIIKFYDYKDPVFRIINYRINKLSNCTPIHCDRVNKRFVVLFSQCV